MAWLRSSTPARSMVMLLFAVVLAIRMAIPTGFMPTRAPSGIVITVCTGMGEVKAFIPIEKQGEKDRHGPAEQPCAFATGLGDGVDVALPLIAQLDGPIFMRPPASRAIADLTVHRLAAPPPPAIGPPARA